jgi:Domain of unknown function (DUF4249)
MLKYLIISSLIFCTVSCSKELSINPKNVEQPWVVVGFLSPQETLIKVLVGKSLKIGEIYDNNQPFIYNQNVVVKIQTSSDSSVTLSWNETTRLYEVESPLFFLKEHETYYLFVKTPDGTLKSTCKIPSKPPNFDIKINSFNLKYQASIDFQDEFNIKNYYRVFGTLPEAPFSKVLEWGTNCDPRTGLFTENLEDGKQISSPISNLNTTCNGFRSVQTGDSLQISLLNTDEAYNRYHNSIYAARSNVGLGDPVSIYTNIEGGVGIFGAYTEQKKSINIP